MVLKVGDVCDQVSEILPVAPDAAGGEIPGPTSEALALCAAVISVDPQDRDTNVILSHFRVASPLPMAGQWVFGPESFRFTKVGDWERLWTRHLMSGLCGGIVPGEPTTGFILRREQLVPLPRALTGRLLGFAGLARGWDGYGGKPIANHTVERAIGVLNYLYRQAAERRISPPAPQMSPTSDGSIQLEWDYPRALFLSVEIPAEPEPLTLYLEYSDGREVEATADSPVGLWNTIEVALKTARGG